MNARHLHDKIKENKMLVIFVAPKDESHAEFLAFIRCTRALMSMQDVEFAFLYPSDFPELGNLVTLLDSEFYQQRNFGIRVYRRHSVADYKDM
jgi:hypothetical protein